MEKYHIDNNITAFGKPVTTFPAGIPEAFDELMALFPKDDPRPYYGISQCTENGILYIAAAHQVKDGEAEKFNYQKYTIEKGDYLAVTVTEWMQKTETIKNVFASLMNDHRSDTSKPCIEIYKNDWEMICLMKEHVTSEPVHE